MNLPIRILSAPPEEPVLCVDGAFGAPGLELSHWPGNRTPYALKHDLSTGCVLAWARLGKVEREELARGCTAIVNNHHDTDGTCALFAARHPEAALERSAALLDAARAGDFFQIPTERALALDALVNAWVDAERSPLGAALADLDDAARHQRAAETLVEELPALLDARELPHAEIWQPVVRAARADLEDLAAAERVEDDDLDLCVFRAPRGARSSRVDAQGVFDPGRHSLFSLTDCDRVLVVTPQGSGATYRMVVSTLSWFDLVSRSALPRPDLEALCARLNELEGTSPEDDSAWRTQSVTNASPELWFGADGVPSFVEHNGHLAPSELDVAVVEREITAACGRSD